MKKQNCMNTTLKCTLALLIMCIALPVAAQRKKRLTFEVGFNHPVNLGERSNEEDVLCLYFQTSYMLKNKPLSIDFRIGLTSYSYTNDTSWDWVEDDGTQIHLPFTQVWETNEMHLIPSLTYHFHESKYVDAYASWGIGLAINNLGYGIFNEGRKYYTVNTPRVGVLLFNHLNLSFEYYLFHKNMNHGEISIGYVF